MCFVLVQKCNTLCPFVYPAVHPLIPQFYGSTRCCVRSLCIDQKPVSYTHLDVYKRQTLPVVSFCLINSKLNLINLFFDCGCLSFL